MEEKSSDPQDSQTGTCCIASGFSLETITDIFKYRENGEEKSGRNGNTVDGRPSIMNDVNPSYQESQDTLISNTIAMTVGSGSQVASTCNVMGPTLHPEPECSEPYKCKYCDKTITQSGDLKMHQRTHTGVKPFKCKYCDKTFTSSSLLKRHGSTHTGVKSFKCKYCDKAFTQNGNLKTHEGTHTGVKPFKCKYCDKAFSSK